MQAFIINMVAVLVQRLLEKGTWERLRELILEAEARFGEDKPGAEKRDWVLSHIASGANWLINLALEAIVAQNRV